jgi:AAA+ ATPase superfamily predicted ATPase
MPDLTYALAEEIGDPELFVGRKKEMARLMKWAEGTKRRISLSTGILSRRKKGKTALLQRFFNILYTRNDPQLIPFYYRIKENRLPKRAFAEQLYRSLLSQYFAFTTRRPDLVAKVLPLGRLGELAASDPHVAEDIRAMEDILERSPDLAWDHAQDAGHRISQLNDVRILQILDEFQYMNRWIVSDHDRNDVELLCHSYMGSAESKFSPQLVAGSYIGWLGAILRHMVGRYHEWHLEGFADEEALEAVYNYAYAYRVPISEETAPYVAEVCENDPFYIASTIRNRSEEKDLTTPEGVRHALALETVMGKGDIARVWNEYLGDAFARVNDVNARKIVLYLAKHDPEERSRAQIREDLDLTLNEGELEKRLHQLVKADILAYGSSYFHYKGLGDPIFAMVFRRLYGTEIEQVDAEKIEDDFQRELAAARGQVRWHKGQAAEYKVRYRLLAASLRGATLADITDSEENLRLGPFATIHKARFYLDHERSVEADLHAVHERDDGTDLVVEVKDWQQGVTRDAVRRFIEVKEALSGHLGRESGSRPTIFLFYSESGLGKKPAAMLSEAGILIVDAAKLATYETPTGL